LEIQTTSIKIEKTHYTKKELAKLYEISSRTLGIYLNKGALYDLLLKNGYFKYQKRLNPKQTEIVFDYLGRPF